jgi:uncharacterized pyridoxal phosphate-containing UPF0001 family protein
VSIADNVACIRERIAAVAARAGRSADEVTLVAVSKTFPAQRIREAYAAGVRHFGENRVQEWESKAAALRDLRDATWHLVGHLQSNKARRAIELFHSVDSVDSLALAQRLDRIVAEGFGSREQSAPGPRRSQNMNAGGAQTQSAQRRLPILIEVRLAPEETKHGVEPHDLPAVVAAVRALPHLDLRGLMCIPPWCANPADARPYFQRLRELRDSTGAGPALSMGMSHDFEVAIAEGATQIRVGTALFGARD